MLIQSGERAPGRLPKAQRTENPDALSSAFLPGSSTGYHRRASPMREHLTQNLRIDPWTSNRFATVSFDKIAFAAACFVAAAEGQLSGGSSGLTRDQGIFCRRIYTGLVEAEESSHASQTGAEGKRQLYDVFRCLWEHNLDQAQHSAICARVLAFHLLMERTEGAAIDGWTTVLEREEALVALHPAVVHAIGQVNLWPDRALSERVFRQQILTCNHCEVNRVEEFQCGELLSAYAH